MSGMRSARVAARVQEELAVLLRSLADPRLQGVFISRVEMTDDLQTAKVYVRHEQAGELPTAARRALLKGFESASGRLRKEVARALALRRVPELRFIYDAGQDSAHRVEELLREIHADDEAQNRKS
ncbi:MAG: 30S ribosome-binding factor RbfA [Polyangiaceae bacterium]|nr:30S ribosome-binding factor RbfA [Polyangiaceae bacterium]